MRTLSTAAGCTYAFSKLVALSCHRHRSWDHNRCSRQSPEESRFRNRFRHDHRLLGAVWRCAAGILGGPHRDQRACDVRLDVRRRRLPGRRGRRHLELHVHRPGLERPRFQFLQLLRAGAAGVPGCGLQSDRLRSIHRPRHQPVGHLHALRPLPSPHGLRPQHALVQRRARRRRRVQVGRCRPDLLTLQPRRRYPLLLAHRRDGVPVHELAERFPIDQRGGEGGGRWGHRPRGRRPLQYFRADRRGPRDPDPERQRTHEQHRQRPRALPRLLRHRSRHGDRGADDHQRPFGDGQQQQLRRWGVLCERRYASRTASC